MSRIILPSIAVTAVAIFLLARRHKVEVELEIEPRTSSSLADTEVLVE